MANQPQVYVSVFNKKRDLMASFYTDNIQEDVRNELMFPKGQGWYYTIKDETITRVNRSPEPTWLVKVTQEPKPWL